MELNSGVQYTVNMPDALASLVAFVSLLMRLLQQIRKSAQMREITFVFIVFIFSIAFTPFPIQ